MLDIQKVNEIQNKQFFEKSLLTVKQLFQDYYRTNPIEMPYRFRQREFGVFGFGSRGMQRHLGFVRSQAIKSFLVRRVPLHFYHSTAYYKFPDNRDMAGKKWMGADLVFDLDADHLKDASEMSYNEQLDNVKKMVIKLVDDFLIPDFGFVPGEFQIVFSGGRGYHVHVRREDIWSLDSKSRRAIVDYIIGMGLDLNKIITSEVISSTVWQNRVTTYVCKRLPGPDEPGWYGKITRGIKQVLIKLEAMEKDKVIKKFMRVSGVGRTIAKKQYYELFEGSSGKRGMDKVINDNFIEVFSKNIYRDKFLEYVIDDIKIEVAGETDEPVTTDIHRLIRVPTSLHGKTGLKVVPVPYDYIDDFDPVVNPVVFPEALVDFTVNKPISLKFNHEKYELRPGETEIPLNLAVFLFGQKVGVII